MKLGEPIDPRIPWVRSVHDLDEAWQVSSSGARLSAVRAAAERLGDGLRDGPRVRAVRTLPITTLPYPTRYAFNGAVPTPFPFVLMHHRALLVQLVVEGETKNLLFNPTDHVASAETPFFKQLRERRGADALARSLTVGPPLEDQLRALGLAPEDIDLIAFDHFHTQDLRPLLGCEIPARDGRVLTARFPNAALLAPTSEWRDWDELHPLQAAWFIRDGKRGVPTDRVVFTEGDLWLGPGALLLRTPGHTSGNQTLFVHAGQGVFGSSENGTSADSWSPYESRIPGLRAQARTYGVEVILNSNTPERAADQYTSMMLERSLVDRVPSAPEFVQMFPSSEVTPWVFCPGVSPSMSFGAMEHGSLITR